MRTVFTFNSMSPCASMVFNYGGRVYLCLLQKKLDRAAQGFCKAEHHKYLVCYSADSLRPVFVFGEMEIHTLKMYMIHTYSAL